MIFQTTRSISEIQRPFDSPACELPKDGEKIDLYVTDDVTVQVKVEEFDFSDLVTLAIKISMLSENKANELAWILDSRVPIKNESRIFRSALSEIL